MIALLHIIWSICICHGYTHVTDCHTSLTDYRHLNNDTIRALHEAVIRCAGLAFTCGVKMIWLCLGWGWQPPQTASHIHIRHIKSNWSHWYTIHGHTVSALHSYTHPTWFIFWDFGSLVESKWCNYIMVEADGLGWEICLEFHGIPRLIRFRTFWTPEFSSEIYFYDRKMYSHQFWTHFIRFRILFRHELFQFHELENVPAIFVSGIILRQTYIYSLLLLVFQWVWVDVGSFSYKSE